MKTSKNLLKVALGAFFLTTVIAYSNNNDPIKNKKDKASSEMVSIESPMELNKEYLTVVHENASQKEAEFLSGVVAQYDVRQSSKFDARNETFTTVFKSNKGFAEVTYDNRGQVIAAEKRLTNVILPTQVSQLVAKRYKDWVIVENKYNVSYKQGMKVDKNYVLTIRKGLEKKKIRMQG